MNREAVDGPESVAAVEIEVEALILVTLKDSDEHVATR